MDLKGDGTHISVAFKTEVLSKNEVHDTPRWFAMQYSKSLNLVANSATRTFIKTAAPNDKDAQENLERECQTYLLPGVSSGTSFRRLYEVVDDHDQANIGNNAFGKHTVYRIRMA